MLAAAAIIPVPAGYPTASVDGESLYQQAQSEMDGRPHIQAVQALLLFSLRETSRGENTAAYMWACRAFGMALELGLHRTGSSKLGQAELETRSRVFWCCYALDKALSEETGRPCLLRARSATVPLPSTNEADEYELWPPPLAPPPIRPANVRTARIQAVRSRTISCFNHTIKLGHIVEQILELDVASGGVMPMDDQALQEEEEWAARRKVRIAKQLDEWRGVVEQQLRIDVQSNVCAPSHWIVNMAWFHSARILLHSRYIALEPDGDGVKGLYGSAHRLCSHAAESIVALLSCLDRGGILVACSSDVRHMLSHAALFHAYDASLPGDDDEASRADINFTQCSLWLREIGKQWSRDSPHRLFFDGCESRRCAEMIPADIRRLGSTQRRRRDGGFGEASGEQSHLFGFAFSDALSLLAAPHDRPHPLCVTTALSRHVSAAHHYAQSFHANLFRSPSPRHASLPRSTPITTSDPVQPIFKRHDAPSKAKFLERLVASCRVVRWSSTAAAASATDGRRWVIEHALHEFGWTIAR